MRRTVLALALLAVLFMVNPGLLSGQGGQDEPATAAGAPGEGAASGGQGETAGQAAGEAGHAATAGEAGHGEAGSHHGGPVVPVLLGLAIILVAAKLGGEAFERFGQPAVLGELIVGMVLGNVALLGWGGLEFLSTNSGIEILAQLGVIVLLFDVGLESNVREMLSVGTSSLLVAVLGVIAPFFLGWGVSAWLLPEEEMLAHIFIGATLCATSVGITARVLTDLGKIKARESKIILGAAVIDDILGLVILAVVTGVIAAANTGGTLEVLDIVLIVVKALLFLGGAIMIGGWLSPRIFRLASKLRVQGMLLVVALVFLFVLSYLADVIGLAPIVGAFAAGLILDEVHYKDFLDRGDHKLEELLHPIATLLVPIFFVWIGTRVEFEAFGHSEILGFAALLTVAAIIGKMICAFGVVERGLDRISVAVGMVPRGEVGLIFAGMGATMVLHGQRVIVPSVFGAVVIMVIVTTLITPPALGYTLARGDRKKAQRTGGPPPPKLERTEPKPGEHRPMDF
jgi:Kef-type K+ transport system membrane component KefB